MSLNQTVSTSILCFVLATAAFPAAIAHAEGHRDRGERALAERAISLDEAVARAERRYQARAVRAEEKRHGDRIEYRIRLLGEDGRVFEIRIDAVTGSEL